jgi:hypothetical protein
MYCTQTMQMHVAYIKDKNLTTPLLCEISANMESVVINNLPKCFNQTNCDCFAALFTKPTYYNPNDILQYTSFNLQEIIRYIENVQAHSYLDQQLNINLHAYVSANEVKNATEHLIETVKKFQFQLLLHANRGEFYCKYFDTNEMSVNRLISFFDELAELNIKSVQLFNKPTSSLPTKNLTDILEMHRNCLYIFQQFYNCVQYGRSIFKKDNYNINIHGFVFRPKL